MGTRVFYRDFTFIALPLRDILKIYGLSCHCTEESITFYKTESKKLVQSCARDKNNKSPWDPLRRSGLLDPENLIPAAEKYFSRTPRKKTVKRKAKA